MDAKQFLEALSEQELLAVQNGLPAEFERCDLALPTIAGSLALESATQSEALITRVPDRAVIKCLRRLSINYRTIKRISPEKRAA